MKTKRLYDKVCSRGFTIYRSLGSRSAETYLLKRGLSTNEIASLFFMWKGKVM